MSLWGGTLWQMCKKWADTNRAHRGEDDLVRGSAEPDVLVHPASCSCMLIPCTHVSFLHTTIYTGPGGGGGQRTLPCRPRRHQGRGRAQSNGYPLPARCCNREQVRTHESMHAPSIRSRNVLTAPALSINMLTEQRALCRKRRWEKRPGDGA